MNENLGIQVNNQSTDFEKQTNYGKGFDFENEFADFLKKSLRYRETVIRRNVPSSKNGKGTNVDIIGFKPDPRRKDNINLGVVIVGVAMLGIALKAFYTMGSQMDDATTSTLISLVLIALFLFGSFYLYKGYQTLEYKHSWVECKNLKDKATINMVKIMFGQYEEYHSSHDNKYNFTELYFVSINGFVDNALELAKHHNIRCFKKDKNNNFIEI